MKVEKITDFLKMPLDKNKKKKHDEAVLQFTASDGRPLEEFTAGAGFKNLCKTVTNDSYVPPVPMLLNHVISMIFIILYTFELLQSYKN